MPKKVRTQAVWKTYWKRSVELCCVFKRKNRRSGTHLRFVLFYVLPKNLKRQIYVKSAKFTLKVPKFALKSQIVWTKFYPVLNTPTPSSEQKWTFYTLYPITLNQGKNVTKKNRYIVRGYIFSIQKKVLKKIVNFNEFLSSPSACRTSGASKNRN